MKLLPVANLSSFSCGIFSAFWCMLLSCVMSNLRLAWCRIVPIKIISIVIIDRTSTRSRRWKYSILFSKTVPAGGWAFVSVVLMVIYQKNLGLIDLLNMQMTWTFAVKIVFAQEQVRFLGILDRWRQCDCHVVKTSFLTAYIMIYCNHKTISNYVNKQASTSVQNLLVLFSGTGSHDSGYFDISILKKYISLASFNQTHCRVWWHENIGQQRFQQPNVPEYWRVSATSYFAGVKPRNTRHLPAGY